MREHTKKIAILHHGVTLAYASLFKDAFSKAKGLMFSRKLSEKEGIILAHDRESIINTTVHMLFVFFPLDIIWLDKHKKVVDYRKYVRPFTLFVKPKEPAQYVVELAPDAKRNINIGDTLLFNPKVKL